MGERSGRRGRRWLEIIHTREVTSLAKRFDVSLDDKLIRFLEEYSEVVLHVTSKQKERRTTQLQLQQELDDANKVVQEEVQAIRRTLFPNNEEAERYFFAVQHQETYLPIVHLAIRGLPELLVHVPRSYATRKKGISFGLLSKSTGGVLWGAAARAANYLRHRCRAQHWELSVSEVVKLWYQQALEIPPEERTRAEKSPSYLQRRRRSIRRRARHDAEMQASTTTADREGKERRAKRSLREGGLEQDSNRSPSKNQKRRRTEKADVAEMQQEASATVAQKKMQKEVDNALQQDKALKPQLSTLPETKTHMANSRTCVVPKATAVERESLKREEKIPEKAELESRAEASVEEEEEPKADKGEQEIEIQHEKRTLDTTADNKNGEEARTKGKLVASEFLTSSSQARNGAQDGEFKQVDIDEGFDTIGGLADYDSDESDYESADHDRDDAQLRQQVHFEQTDTDIMDSGGRDESNGGVVEGGKTVEKEKLQSEAKEARFASYRFADALSAVNLAGNDGATPVVKREDEEHVV